MYNRFAGANKTNQKVIKNDRNMVTYLMLMMSENKPARTTDSILQKQTISVVNRAIVTLTDSNKKIY